MTATARRKTAREFGENGVLALRRVAEVAQRRERIILCIMRLVKERTVLTCTADVNQYRAIPTVVLRIAKVPGLPFRRAPKAVVVERRAKRLR